MKLLLHHLDLWLNYFNNNIYYL